MRVFVLLVVLGVVASSPVAAAAPVPSEAIPAHLQRRVRALETRVQDAIALGTARSAAFRDVLRRVELRDVIVYVEFDPQLRGRLAGRMRWVAATLETRYVRVSLNPELTGSLLVATLAHELQHVVEVGDAPSIVDEASLKAFYRDNGTGRQIRSDAWDTEAAQLTGDTVRRELAAATVVTTNAPLILSRAASGQ